MAKKVIGEIVEQPKPQVLTGFKNVATIRPGWRFLAQADGRLLMSHPDHPPRIVDLATVEEGDELPRDTDEALGFAPAVGGV